MIPKYHEASQEVELHSQKHNVCTHELEDGWECSCSQCMCEAIVNIQAAYAWDNDGDHKVIVKVNPGQYRGSSAIALTPERARALASYLMFAANDADTLNRDYPTERETIERQWSEDTSDHFPSTEDADGF